MTCIVGLVHAGGVTLGADSQTTSGWVHTTMADSLHKVFRVADMLIGSTGTARMSQLVQYALSKPEHPADMECVTYLVTHFADAVRDCLKTGGYAIKDKEQEMHDGSLLIGYRGRLFSLDTHFAINEVADGYYAIGSGQEVALGSMHTSDRMGDLLSPEKRVTWALEAAATFSNGVGGPFVIETLAHETAQESEAA
jgi:ATP-dependent protease HslVU (ClpYQ) peptidase subunit